MPRLPTPILPGATIGVLGSGQLGRMFAIAARRMGYRVRTLSPEIDTPTGQIADEEIRAAYDDLDAVREFARQVDVITFEFENVPADAVHLAEEFVPVRPAGSVLHTTQHRLREKRFLTRHGFPVAPFREVSDPIALEAALAELGCPAVLKTAGFGYDGKGQARISSRDAAAEVWRRHAEQEMVLEAFVDFARELSVIGARAEGGEFVHWGVIENTHANHILDASVAPAGIVAKVAREAVEITRSVMEALDVVGVLCVEFFLTHDGRLLVNEVAPRPHNSGHFTFDACVTSQFEQQLRAVCGLPLGSTEQYRPAAMANLLGELWQRGEPAWPRALAYPHVKLHLYGKVEPRPGRKMGHLTALADSPHEARERVLKARASVAVLEET